MLLHNFSEIAPGAIMLGSFIFFISALFTYWKNYGLPRMISVLFRPISAATKRAKAWSFLFQGPRMIQEGYEKANGAPYEIFAPDNRYVFVSLEKHIKEVDNAPDTVLSLQAASKQMLQPKYTMHNFNWFDRRGTEGIGLVKALRTLLTNNVPEILPEFRDAISGLFDQMYESHPVINDIKVSPLREMVLEAVAHINALAFFGKELAHSKDFMKSAIEFIENTLLVAEIIRLLPSAIAPTIGRLLASRYKSHEIIFNAMVPIAEQRLEERTRQQRGHRVETHKDCIQWIIETSPKQKPWSAERIVHEIMAIWFGSVHVLSTTICFAVHDLCLHPEYVKPLRVELESPQYIAFEKTGKGLPLLDSFIRESARTTPVESMSTRRQALEPFTLSNGTRVEVGDWVCTPLRAMMRDPANFSAPLEFHGFRFVDPKLFESLTSSDFKIPQPGKPSELTDVTGWHVWGTGRMACPGRYYAAAVMKVVLALFITKYDCQLSDPEASRWVSWRTFIYPRGTTTVILRPRQRA